MEVNDLRANGTRALFVPRDHAHERCDFDSCHAVEQGIFRIAANCSPTPGERKEGQGQREIQDDHRDTKAVT